MQIGEYKAALLHATSEGEQRQVIIALLAEPTNGNETIMTLAQELKNDFDLALGTAIEQAFAIAERIHRLGTIAKAQSIVALGMLAKADATSFGGRPAEAMAIYQQAGEEFLAAGDHVGWARTRSGRLLAAARSGHAAEGLAEIETAQNILKMAGPSYRFRLAVLYQNIGLAHYYLGESDTALADYDRALEVLETVTHGPVDRLRTQLLANKANIYLIQGQPRLALEEHRKLRRVFAEGHMIAATALEDMNIASIERLRGYYAEALEATQAAIRGFEEAGQAQYVAAMLGHSAHILLALNRPIEARDAATEAVATLRELQSRVDLAETLQTQAVALERAHQYDAALAALTESESILHEAGYTLKARTVAVERAALLIAQGRVTEARDLALTIAGQASPDHADLNVGLARVIAIEAALALNNIAAVEDETPAALALGMRLDAPEITYRGHLALARAALSQGEKAAARAAYDAAIAALRPMLSGLVHDQRSGFLEDKDRVFLEALFVAIDQGDATGALDYIEQARARVRLAPPTRRRASGALTTTQIALANLREQHRWQSWLVATLESGRSGLLATARETALSEARTQLTQLDRRMRDLTEQIARARPKRTGTGNFGVFADLPTDMTTLAYALGEHDLAIFVITGGEVVAKRVVGGASRIHKIEEGLRHNIDIIARLLVSGERGSALAQWEAQMRVIMRGLWNLLIAPVEHLLPADGERIAIVPHATLRALPLVSMFDGQRFLIERWVVQLSPSVRERLKAPPLSPVRRARPPLVIGFANQGMLPEATAEATHIAQIVGGEAWTDEAATGSRLRSDGPGREMVHLAAHGEMRWDLPTSSFVQLADGPFHPLDFRDLDLRGCRLVTLSACETGLARISGGDDQIGLTRALFQAGAQAVLASLWRVEDTATAALMDHLYQRIRAKLSPAAALREAQLSMIRGESTGDGFIYTHPYFWAGFQLTTVGPDTRAHEA